MFSLLVIMATCGLARRGAGGYFAEHGITKLGDNNAAHGLGSLLVGVALGIKLGSLLWIAPLAVLWFAATKPTPHQMFKLINNKLTFGVYKAAIGRALYFLPIVLLSYYINHGISLNYSLLFLSLFAIAPMPYYLGMKIYKDGDKAVVFGEYGHALIGVMLWGVTN